MEKAGKLCDKIIEYSFYLLFFFVPLILTPWNYELFEYNKMMLTYGLAVIILGAWLAKMVVLRQFRVQRTPLDLPLILFALSQIASTIFSIDRHTSIWGYYSRFHQGLLATLSYIFLYYAFVSNFNDRQKVFKALIWVLGSGLIVAAYGIAEHFGIDAKYWVQDVKNRVFSTLGQPNWLAAYLAVLIPIAMAFGLGDKKLRFPIFYLLFSIFYLCLLYTKSRSGFFGLAVGLFVFAAILFYTQFQKKNKESLRQKLLSPTLLQFSLMAVILLATTFFVGSPFEKFNQYGSFTGLKQKLAPSTPGGAAPAEAPSEAEGAKAGPALEVGGTESGTIRQIVWKGAFDIFRNSPLFGSGVETFAYSYYQFRPPQHNLVSEWDFLYNKAHNEYLNFLATTGAFGLGSYLLLIGWFLIWSLNKFKNQISKITFRQKTCSKQAITNKNSKFDILNCGLDICILPFAFLAAYISIVVSNFFGFSVVIIGIFFFFLPAFSFILTESLNPQKAWVVNFGPKRAFQWALIIFILLSTFYFLNSLFRIWRADKAFALGYNLEKAGDYVTAYQHFHQALSLNKNEPFYWDEFSHNAAVLAVATFQENQATLSGQLLKEAQIASDKAVSASPKNVNFWKTRTKVFYTLSALDLKYNQEALEAISEAKKLAPTDAKVSYNLGLLYGLAGQSDLALKTLEETVALKPNYPDARYALALYLWEAGRTQEAISQLEYILEKIDPGKTDIKTKLEEWKQ